MKEHTFKTEKAAERYNKEVVYVPVYIYYSKEDTPYWKTHRKRFLKNLADMEFSSGGAVSFMQKMKIRVKDIKL